MGDVPAVPGAGAHTGDSLGLAWGRGARRAHWEAPACAGERRHGQHHSYMSGEVLRLWESDSRGPCEARNGPAARQLRRAHGTSPRDCGIIVRGSWWHRRCGGRQVAAFSQGPDPAGTGQPVLGVREGQAGCCWRSWEGEILQAGTVGHEARLSSKT